MSDYNFYGANVPQAANTGACTFNSSTQKITTANTFAGTGDVVYFKISDTEGAVGVCQEVVTDFLVDTNVYTYIPSSFTPSSAYHFVVPNDLLYSDVTSFQFEVSANVASYSESYRPYNTSFDYKIIVDNKRRLFHGDLKTLISTTYTVFKDGCNDYAYLVTFGDDVFTTLNNRFKSSIEFNVATR